MMQKRVLVAFALALLVGALSGAAYSQAMMAKGPSIEGTYRLVSRTTADGKTMKPPEIVGMQTFTKTYRNFNVVWTNPDGKRFALAISSTYSLNSKEYTESLLSSVMIDEIMGKGTVITTTPETKTAPVKMEGGKIIVKLPFDPPVVSFEGDKFTAVSEGQFTDQWERVK